MRLLSVVTHCFNEVHNVEETAQRIREVFALLGRYEYEHIFIDNASTDGTQDVLRKMASSDSRIKIILNSRNFGVDRSGYHGFLQARGEAVVTMAADLQDPPELIAEFVKKWEEGFQAVLAVKRSAGEARSMYLVRELYYAVMNRLSEIPLQRNYYGFGLYDRVVVEAMRSMGDPVPYFRGMVMEAGFRQTLVYFDQPARKRGKSSYNFFKLYSVAMLGLTSHSRVPLRLATMAGFAMSGLSFLVGLAYLIYKLLFWNEFTLGLAPLLVAVFFLGSVQLFFTGMLGEYVGAIYTHVRHRPHVIEAERINFEPVPARSFECPSPRVAELEDSRR